MGSLDREGLKIELGDQVLVAGQKQGVVRFYGKTDFAPGKGSGGRRGLIQAQGGQILVGDALPSRLQATGSASSWTRLRASTTARSSGCGTSPAPPSTGSSPPRPECRGNGGGSGHVGCVRVHVRACVRPGFCVPPQSVQGCACQGGGAFMHLPCRRIGGPKDSQGDGSSAKKVHQVTSRYQTWGGGRGAQGTPHPFQTRGEHFASSPPCSGAGHGLLLPQGKLRHGAGGSLWPSLSSLPLPPHSHPAPTTRHPFPPPSPSPLSMAASREGPRGAGGRAGPGGHVCLSAPP